MPGTLYGAAVSSCTQRVYVVAHELGVDVKLTNIDVMKGEHKQPTHLARQPFGQIPAFESTDGVKLFESRAIGRFLDAQAGDKLSHRKNLAEFALVETWSSVEAFNFDKHASALAWELVFKQYMKLTTDEAAVAKSKEQLIATLDIYEKELAKRKFLAGDFLSLADLFHLPYANLLQTRPNVKKWYDTLFALPSWQKTLAMGTL